MFHRFFHGFLNWHLIVPQVVVEVNGSKGVHHDVVEKLQVVAFFVISQIFGKYNV